MRILTHNMLCCIKCDHFPLTIQAQEKVEEKQDENLAFIKRMIPRLDYKALLSAAKDLDIAGLPAEMPSNIEDNEAALKSFHRLLVEVRIKEGSLKCSKCERVYPVKNGIPNMVLREDEVNEKKFKKLPTGSTSENTTTVSSTTTTTSTNENVSMETDNTL